MLDTLLPPPAPAPETAEHAHAETLLSLVGEVHALLIAHGALWQHYTTFRSAGPSVVFRLAAPGRLRAYFDAQRIPIHRDGDGTRLTCSARWRDALITWPAEADAARTH